MSLKTVQNSSFQGLKKRAQRFVLSSVATKSGFVATEFVANFVVTKSGFVTIEFVINSVATKSGFCRKKVLSLALSRQNLVLSQQSLLLTLSR